MTFKEIAEGIFLLVFGLAVFITACILMLRDEYMSVKETLEERTARKRGREKKA